MKYSLPSPLSLLSHPLSKVSFKTLVKKRVVDFWQQEIWEEAKSKPSLLKFFKPDFMSLLKPHPLWTTAQSNQFEINKSLVVAKLLSGHYRYDWLCRHWSKTNPSGHWLLYPGMKIPGTVEHMLVSCPGLNDKRDDLILYWNQRTEDNPHLHHLTSSMLSSEEDTLIQFLLYPSAVPSFSNRSQQKLYSLSDVFKLTRTFCYGIHRRRLQLIGRFKFNF